MLLRPSRAAIRVAAVVLTTLPVFASHQQPAAPGASAAPQQAPVRVVSPAERAFEDARAVKDPDARLRAFQKLREDFPDSPVVRRGAPDFNILSLTTAAIGKAAAEARRAAAACAAIPEPNRDNAAWANIQLAMAFERTGLMWPEAEHYAREALRLWDSGPSKEPPRMAGFALERAVPLAVLGRALARQGRDEDALPVLREAYDARGDEPGVVREVVPELLAIATRRGRTGERTEYLGALALYGQLTPDRRRELEGLYRESHGGSLDGLEAMLDARYEAEKPKVVRVEPFVRDAKTGRHTVLAEMFTGASCAPCVGMDLALEAAMRRYPPSDLAVLVYHLHSPAADPLVNPVAEARAKTYGIHGAPHLFVDGAAMDDQGGGSAAEAAQILRTRLQPAIERALETPAEAALAVRASRVGDLVRARVTADHLPAARGTVRLHVALVEDHVRYSGGNGIRFHPMVVRAAAGGAEGMMVPGSGRVKTEVSFDLQAVARGLRDYLDTFETKGNSYLEPAPFVEKTHAIDGGRLSVVAFLQDAVTRKIVQAAVVRLDDGPARDPRPRAGCAAAGPAPRQRR